MSQLCEELESKFNAIEAKIKDKIRKVNDTYKVENELLETKFDINILKEKYSNELNVYRDELLNRVSRNMVLEINHANEMQAEIDENVGAQNLLEKLKDTNKFKFKKSLIKSNKICIRKIINSEFKFGNRFSFTELPK